MIMAERSLSFRRGTLSHDSGAKRKRKTQEAGASWVFAFVCESTLPKQPRQRPSLAEQLHRPSGRRLQFLVRVEAELRAETAADVQILDHGRQRLIQRPQQARLVRVERLLVRVPTAERDRDEADARFDEPTRGEGALAERRVAVALTHGRHLALEVE